MPSRDCWPYLIRGNGTETGGDVPKETQLVECGDLLEAMWDVLFCAQAPPGWAHGTEKVSFTLLPLRAWVRNGLHQNRTYISALARVVRLMYCCRKPLWILKIQEAFFKLCFQWLVCGGLDTGY